MRRLLRSLQAQLFLWAVMPVTLVIIGLSFTSVYAHQRTMRDFVIERDIALAQLAAQIAQDGLAGGIVSPEGHGLSDWMALHTDSLPVTIIVLGGQGQVLARSFPGPGGQDVQPLLSLATPTQTGGSVIVQDKAGPVLVTFVPVIGTDWTVVIQEPVEALIGPVLRFPSIAPAVAAGASVISVLILTFGWLTIVRPLQRLARSAGQVSWGNYTAIQESPRGVQEVRDLHQSIVEMVERIRSYEAGMRDYLGAVTQGQETERARLARELHDGPVQSLIALGQRAEMAQRSVGRDQAEQAQALLEELRQTARDSVQELRRLIGALRPVYLEDLGFAPALRALVQEASERTHVPIRLEFGEDIKRLGPRVELAAYRIAQEALNNALQHAQPQHITVRLYCEGQTLVLTVHDDGIGFELPQQPDLLTRTGHFGLIDMRERAMLLGGELEIRTTPGRGTVVTARLPDRPIDG